MSISAARIGAVVRKELTEFRRSPFIVSTMGIFPVIFLILPTVGILTIKAAALGPLLDKRVSLSLLYLLLIPVFVPATVAAYSVVGEREQETLEPVLSTPVSREELLIGKAAAIFLPAIGLAYLMFGIFLAVVRFGARPVIATAVWHSPALPAEVLFIPLLVGWMIWIGLAISSRASDIRVAQQLGILSSLPPVVLTALMSFQVISPTLAIVAALAGALLVIDCAAYLVVAKLFDRERLVAGTRPWRHRRHAVTPGAGAGQPLPPERINVERE
jgi:ABC-type transport system involved in multi-copper enzyme maturation permease subunit